MPRNVGESSADMTIPRVGSTGWPSIGPRSHLRRIARERGALEFEPGCEQRLPDPQLIDAVMTLPIGYRAVIVARFFLDRSVEETARVLQIPNGTVKTRTHRALKRLRKLIEE